MVCKLGSCSSVSPLRATSWRRTSGAGQAANQARGAKGGVGPDVVGDEVLDVVEQARQVELNGLTSPAGGGVLAGDSGTAFVQGLAKGVPSPAEEQVGLALSQAESRHGFRQVATASRSPGESVSGTPNQVNDFGSQIHGRASCQWAAGIVQTSPGKAIP